MTSISVKQPIDGLMLSNALRTGLTGFAKTLSREVVKDNILINTVCPGMFYTSRLENLVKTRAANNHISEEEQWQLMNNNIPIGRVGRTEEFAPMVVFLCSEKATYITGDTIQIDGGYCQGLL